MEDALRELVIPDQNRFVLIVLILILMEDALRVPYWLSYQTRTGVVLILILMEDALRVSVSHCTTQRQVSS